MIFITGPLFAGKKQYVRTLGLDPDSPEVACGAQELARTQKDLEALADGLAQKRAVICTEVGGGIVPMDREERLFRERAGRLSVLLAQRAETVVRVWCGLPEILKGEPPC